jgi:hypothetical protein
MVGLVIIRARHAAKIRAKSLILSEKAFSIIAHLCSEMVVFGRKLPSGKLDRSDTQQQTMLSDST